MKKLFILFLFPFAIHAQEVIENKNETTETADVWTGDKSKEYSFNLLESYRQRVLKGEKMSDLAKLYSEDPGSAKNGGLYANVKRGMMVPEFENVAFSLKSGEISKVFETKYGFHFIQVVSNHGETVDVRHILLMFK